jgi:MFS family permease
VDTSERTGARRWAVLFAGVVAITAGCAFQYGLPFLVPSLRAQGLSLGQAATLVACPSAGLLLTLVAWGAAADRWGERAVLTAGMTLAVPALLGASVAAGPVLLGGCLVAAGAAGACVHAASGRLILGWFGAHERGLAMGIRQTAQPIGVGLSALALPVLGAGGPGRAFAALAGFCALAVGVVVLVVRDPVPAGGGAVAAGSSPYRRPRLWRLHASSALLVVPQFTVAAFALTYLVDQLGWTPATGGRLLAVVAAAGAAARLTAGWWSDRIGSRVGPLRLVAAGIAVAMAALAAGAAVTGPDRTHPLGAAVTGSLPVAAAIAALLVASVLTVSPNGLAFTAVAEDAGRAWAGRALGIQNTGQNAVAALTPPVIAAVVGGHGYPLAFALAGVPAVLAWGLIPRDRG